MSETPITPRPELQGRLTDRQIENKVTEAEKRGDFDLWEEQVNPPTYFMPEQSHEVVAPVAQLETFSHGQELQRGYETSSNETMLADIDKTGTNLEIIRDAAIHQSFPQYDSHAA